jgi:hypothetical protein
MCNAYNHPTGCTCGWGGPGHRGRRESAPGGSQTFVAPSFQSYVNPHARCPECGLPVFFYQSENGGRVFFDELGPPWPKHPCTDRLQQVATLRIEWFTSAEATKSRTGYPWERDGWVPFVVMQVMQLPPNFRYCELKGLYANEQLTLYFRKRALSPKAPYQLRRRNGRFELSTYQHDADNGGALGQIQGSCYRSLAELERARNHGAKRWAQIRQMRGRSNGGKGRALTARSTATRRKRRAR